MKNELAYFKQFSSDYVPDCLFPFDNEFEIPSLLLDMQATTVDVPFVLFGEQRRTMAMNGSGTLHFYTDDYRFNSVYEHPQKIMQHNPRNIIEPNFSLFDTTPIGLGLASIYKKRFLARVCQNAGIRVFVDLNVSPKFLKANLFGVPLGWSSFATRGYSDRLDQLQLEYQIGKTIANGNFMTFVVYGGGKNVKQFCMENGCVYITPIITIKNKIKSLEKLNGISYDPKRIELCPDYLQLFEKQVCDFTKNQISDGKA